MDNDKQNIKVDTYDFFGYLIPGFILFMALVILHLPVINFQVSNFTCIINAKIETYQFIVIVFIVLVMSYIFGHVVASIASFIFEKLIIKNLLKYPYSVQLEIPQNQSQHTNNCFFKIALLLSITSMFIVCIFPSKLLSHFTTLLISLFVLSILCKTNAIHKIIQFIFTPVDKLVLDVLKRPLPLSTIDRLRNKFQSDYSIQPTQELGSEIFWAIYWKVVQNDIYIKGKIDKWLVLYSFMRNLGCALLMAAIVLVLRQYIWGESLILKVHSCVMVSFSIILTIRYYYLYYNYYSKSIFRIYAYLDIPAQNSTKNQEHSD